MTVITEAISFYHELDLLEAHLEESSKWADRIVIIESDKTFTGVDKPMLFHENRERFSRFNVDYLETPSELFKPIPEVWEDDEYKEYLNRRRYNRNFNRQYHWDNLRNGCDYVYLNDTDEFISHTKTPLLKGLLADKSICYVEIKTGVYNYYVNNRSKGQAQYRMARSDMSDFVMSRDFKRGACPEELGWHFTDCFTDPIDFWYKALGVSTHCGVPISELPSKEEMYKRIQLNRHPWFPNFEERGPMLGAKKIMSREDRSWAPTLMQTNPDMFPWLDINNLPPEFNYENQ